jgi:hypothetical protein
MVCSFEPCEHEARARGLCTGHYRQQSRGQSLRPLLEGRRGARGPRTQGSTCSFEGCGRKPNGRGLCAAHRAQRKQGCPLVPIGAAKRWWYPIEGRDA